MKTKCFTLWGLCLLAMLLCACVTNTSIQPTPTPSPVSSPTPVPATATPQPTPDPTSACFGESRPVFTDYAAWTKVNPQPISGHETKVNIYVDDLARNIYLTASGDTFPTCATIVKTHLFVGSDGAETVTALTVMVKLPAGYDPENNDWWWGMYDSTGKNPQMTGKIEACITCHKPQAEADFVFSQTVLEQSGQ